MAIPAGPFLTPSGTSTLNIEVNLYDHVTLTTGFTTFTVFCMRVAGCCVVVEHTRIRPGIGTLDVEINLYGDVSVHVTLTTGGTTFTVSCMSMTGCCVIVVAHTRIQPGTTLPIQETNAPDPYQHIRHFPPDLVEEWILNHNGNAIPIEETGQQDPDQVPRQRVPINLMDDRLRIQRRTGVDELVHLSRTVTPAD